MMQAHKAKIAVAAMILGCCATGQAKKRNQKEDPLARKSFNAPIDSVYAAAAAVAARQWQVTSLDNAAHSLSFETTNTKLETAGGYSTYRVAVTCMATPAGGTEVRLEVVEHKVDQPSLMALMNKSERRKGMLQDFWDGIDAALKKSAPAAQAPANTAPSAPAPPAATTAARPAPPVSAPAPPAPPAPAAPPATPEPRLLEVSKTPPPSAAGELAVVTFKSTPEGADIIVDGKFIGDTPSTARLPSGDRVISIEKAGYKPWKRTVTLTEGGAVTLDATLENSG
jgi:PEGA domain